MGLSASSHSCSKPGLPSQPHLPPCHSFALQATCHSGHPVGCCLCMFLSLPFALAQPGMFSHPLRPISVSTQLLPPLFYMHCFCPGCVACTSSHEALEGRVHILPCSRLRPPKRPPYRRASKAMGWVMNGTLGWCFQAILSFGGTVVLLVLGLWGPVYWLMAQGSGTSLEPWSDGPGANREGQ